MAAPAIRVNGGAAGVKAAVTAFTAWTATLDSTAGVRSCVWEVISTDETTSTASYTLVQSGSVGQTVASTALGAGTALILKVTINGGINLQTGLADAANTTAKVKIGVLTSAALWVGCAGEETEHDSTFGSTEILNYGPRLASELLPSGFPIHIVRAATAAALPANTRTGNVLTADANGAFAAVDGATVAVGEYFVAQTEGGGASHINNGAYQLTTAGDGSNPWTATRATYFDESAELVKGTRFTVQSGTTYGGSEVYLVTDGATINVTPLEFSGFGFAPTNAQYLTRTANPNLSNETAIDAITGIVEFESTTVTPLGAKRTDAATSTTVDALQCTALSSGTAVVGFGVSQLFKGDIGGAPENYGRVGFTATDLTGASEDTKAVLSTRTAGAALASCAEFSGTGVTLTGVSGAGTQFVTATATGVLGRADAASAVAPYLVNAATPTNANDVPIQAITSTLSFASTTVLPIASLREDAAFNSVVDVERSGVNTSGTAAANFGIGKLFQAETASGGAAVDIGRQLWRWSNATALSATSQWGIQLRNNGDGLATLQLYVTGDGDLHALKDAYAVDYYGASFDASSATTLPIGDTFATQLDLYTSATLRHRIETTGRQTRVLDNGKPVLTTYGSNCLQWEAMIRFSTVNATPVNVLSYPETGTLPASFTGSVLMIVDAHDVSNTDKAHYERRYSIDQRSSSGVTLTSIGTDIESESDATWDAMISESGGVISVRWTGDATNQVDGGAVLIVRITEYSAV